MRFAFYKGRDTVFSKLCAWKMEGNYTHVEALFQPSSFLSHLTVCGSATFKDGVRIASLDFADTSLWDIVEVSGIDEAKSFQWFKDHNGQKYNFRGILQFITLIPAGNTSNSWFCDQACLASIGMTDSYRFDPNGMYDILMFLKNYHSDSPR